MRLAAQVRQQLWQQSDHSLDVARTITKNLRALRRCEWPALDDPRPHIVFFLAAIESSPKYASAPSKPLPSGTVRPFVMQRNSGLRSSTLAGSDQPSAR